MARGVKAGVVAVLGLPGLLVLSGPSAWAACVKTDTRFALSSNTLYIEQPVTCTLTELAAFVKTSVLELVDPARHVWLLKSNVRITGGGTLLLHGTTIGGDVDELRLLSSPAQIIRINPRWGTLDVRSTHIQSWDPATGGPDTDTSDGRSYIHAESFLDADGVTARESRMDVVDSEINHLGYYAAVSYGLVWKVVGDVSVTPNLYDLVNVYGSLVRSNVHHNYMGFYSFGAYGMEIADNTVAFNEAYGIDPHDDSDALLITRNVSHDNGSHGIICSRRCDHLTITDNETYNNDHGIMLHREVVDTLVANNHSHHNRDNGIALFESHNNVVRDNRVEYNANGIRLSLGSHDNVVENNIVRGNTENGLYLYKGEDPPETTDGRPKDNVFRNNTVADNGRLIKVRDADRIQFTGNVFSGAVADIEIYDSTAIDIVGNVDNLVTLDIANRGAVSGFSEVRLESDRDLETKLDAFASITLTNPAGRIFKLAENGGEVSIGPQGSEMVVSYALTGSTSDVSALPLFAGATAGSFTVLEPATGVAASSWRVRAAAAGQGVQFRVAALAPGADYKVLRDGVLVAVLAADASGELSFSDSLPAGEFAYAVELP
jgi:parallel beta-helix repeat protein